MVRFIGSLLLLKHANKNEQKEISSDRTQQMGNFPDSTIAALSFHYQYIVVRKSSGSKLLCQATKSLRYEIPFFQKMSHGNTIHL